MGWLEIARRQYLPICVVIFTIILLQTRDVIGCEFPAFIQSNASSPEGGRIIRNWHSRVRNQNSESTLRLHVNAGVVETISTDNTATSYTRVCLQTVGRNKYLVAHEQEGQDTNKYTCIQFLQRSNSVIQIREASLSNSMGKNLCQALNMELKEWLVIDRNHIAEENQPCPLVGGFSIQIYDKIYREGVCDVYQGKTRLESECSQGEGLYFYFRYRQCVPQDLLMYTSQKTICITNWRTGPYTFVLLKHSEDHFLWLLRYPSSKRESFTSVLLMDLVADMSSLVKSTDNYLRLAMVRDTPRPAHSLCLDDYEVCSYFDDPCTSPEMKLTCPRSCGVCNVTRPVPCQFQSKLQSQWYNSAQPGTVGLSINATRLTTYHEQVTESFHCIQWDEELPNDDPSSTTKMLVKEFNNGCRPRFTCVEFKQQTSSILFTKLSEEHTWPFTKNPEERLDCRHFAYKDYISVIPNPFKSKNLNLVYLRTSNTVPCDISEDITDYKVTFSGGAQCTVSVVVGDNMDTFSLELTNCPLDRDDIETSYSCVDSSRMQPRRDQLVVTRSMSQQDVIHCWLFPKGPSNVFYLVDAKDCNESIRKRLNKNRLKYIAVFSPTGLVPKISEGDKTIVESRPTLDSSPKGYRPSDTTDRSLNDDYRVIKDDGSTGSTENNNGSHDNFNKTASGKEEDTDFQVTATSVVVVGTVFTFAVIQSVCICKS